MTDNNADWNERLSRLWLIHSKITTQIRLPAYQSPLQQNAILFIGMNPSFSWPHWRKFLNQNNIDSDPDEYFSWKNLHGFDRSLALKEIKQSKNEHAYFKPMRDYSVNFGLPWDHADSFFIRETSQKRVEQYMLKNNDPIRLSDFGASQYELAIELIIKSTPRIIVVVNALASKIWKTQFKLESIDQNIGTYV